MTDVKELLRTSSKGQLRYDRTWEADGRVQEIIDDVRNQLLTISVCPVSYDNCDENREETVVDPLEDEFISPLNVLQELSLYEVKRSENVEASAYSYASDVSDYLMEMEDETEDEIIEIRKKHYNAVIERLNNYQDEYRTMMNEVLGRLSLVAEESASVKLRQIQTKHRQQLEEKERKYQDDLTSRILTSKREVESEISKVQQFFTSNMVESQPYHALIEEAEQTLVGFHDRFDSLLSQKLSEDSVDEAKRISDECKSFVAKIPSKSKGIIEEYKSLTKAKDIAPQITAVESSTQSLFSNSPSNTSLSSLKQYLEQQTALGEFESALKDFVDDSKIKPYRLNLQQYIRTNINAISTGSDEHLKQKYRNLCQLFDGRSINFQDKVIKATSHPKALEFCMSFAAKTFISVGSKQVLSVPKAAFPMAAIIVLLWGKHPVFGRLFHAMIMEKCPFIGLFYPVKEKGESDTTHLISSGYVFGADGKTLESEESYINRMRALVRMYASVVASNMGQDHPHGIDQGWKWIAGTCSVQPVPLVSAAVIHAFLSAAFFRLQRVYGIQAVKILRFISSTYIPMIEAETGQEVKKQSIAQLSMFVDETFKKLKRNQSLKPEGFLPDYFWQKSFLNS